MTRMFGNKFPLPVLSEELTFSTDNVTVAAGSTVYIYSIDQSGTTFGGTNATEAIVACNYLVTRAGLLRNLVARSQAAPGAGQTFTYTVRINGAPTAMTCQIAGAVAVTSSDLVNTAEVVIGDRVSIEIVASGAAVVIRHASVVAMDTPSTRKAYEKLSFTSFITTIAANLTDILMSLRRASTSGGAAGVASEADIRYGVFTPRKGTLKNLVALAGAAPGVGQTFVYTVRVNGVNTAMTVTLSGAVQLTGTDIVNVVQVDPSDGITLQVVTSLAAAVTTHAASFDFEEGDYRAG